MKNRKKYFALVAEEIAKREQIKPFMNAWSEIATRFEGISDLDNSLDPVYFIHQKFSLEIQRNNIITEEDLFVWLLSLPVLKLNIIDHRGNVFCPIHQSFSEFVEGKEFKSLITSNKLLDNNYLDNYSSWLISICDWSSSSVKTTKLH